MDRGAWRATVDGVSKSWTRQRFKPGQTPSGMETSSLLCLLYENMVVSQVGIGLPIHAFPHRHTQVVRTGSGRLSTS